MFRFIHSSDLHLGKPYGQMPDDDRNTRGRLKEARFKKIETLREVAEAEGATHILLAGDTFDAETPSPAIRRRVLRAMGEDRGIQWVILPGNHDSLAADELWRALAEACPASVTLALSPEPIRLDEGVTLLPAPCPGRRAGHDLSAWMDGAETPDTDIRIGLAHGAVQSFSEDGAAEVIAPDRATRARLDYLALGDWHGRMQVEPRTWYSGTPEADRFRHDDRAGVLSVTIPGPGAPSQVEAIPTSEFQWLRRSAELLPDADPLPQVEALFPSAQDRQNALIQLTLSGRIRPENRAALLAMLSDVSDDFPYFDWRERALSVEYDAGDLDRIDQAGVLRAAADALHAETVDEAVSEEGRAIARAALNRLYGYAVDAP